MSRKEEVRRVQELRRSSAARPVPSGKRYQRKAKHGKMEIQAKGEETQT